MEINSIEGKKVIMASFVNLLLKINFRLISFLEGFMTVGDWGLSVMKYSVSSFSADILTPPDFKATVSFSASGTISVMWHT